MVSLEVLCHALLRACFHVLQSAAGDAAQLPPLPAMRTMQMADRTGKKYTCRVPAADQLAAKNLTSRAGQVGVVRPADGTVCDDTAAACGLFDTVVVPMQADSSAKKKQTPSEMLDELSESCMTKRGR